MTRRGKRPDADSVLISLFEERFMRVLSGRDMKRYSLVLALAVIAGGGVPALASGAGPGDLDASFSGDGRQTTEFGGADAAAAVAVQADGKIVVAGSSDGDFAVARYG